MIIQCLHNINWEPFCSLLLQYFIGYARVVVTSNICVAPELLDSCTVVIIFVKESQLFEELD